MRVDMQPEVSKPTSFTTQEPPKKARLWPYFLVIYILLIIVAAILPNGPTAEFLAYPTILLGVVGGISMLIQSFRLAGTKNAVYGTFIFIAGAGVAVVIFLVCLATGFAISIFKDPQPTG